MNTHSKNYCTNMNSLKTMQKTKFITSCWLWLALLLQACVGEPTVLSSKHVCAAEEKASPTASDGTVAIKTPREETSQYRMTGLLLGGMQASDIALDEKTPSATHLSVGQAQSLDISIPTISHCPSPLIHTSSTLNAWELLTPTSREQADTKVQAKDEQQSMDHKQHQALISTTQELVTQLNQPASISTVQLINLFRQYNNFFDGWRFPDMDLGSILEYSNLAKVQLRKSHIKTLEKQLESCPNPEEKRKLEQVIKEFKARQNEDAAIAEQLLKYLEVWRTKIDQGYAKKHFTQGLEQVLVDIDTAIFDGNPTHLTELGASLLKKLPDDKSRLTLATYPSHKSALSALHQILIHHKIVCPDTFDPNDPKGLYYQFKEKIDVLTASPYYPIQYQAKLIGQELVLLKTPPSKAELRKQQAWRAYYGFKGITQVAQSIAGIAMLNFDFEDFEEGLTNTVAAYQGSIALVDGKVTDISVILGAQALQVEGWYGATKQLLQKALGYLSIQDKASFEAQQKIDNTLKEYSSYAEYCDKGYTAYAQARDAALQEVSNGDQRTALQYGVASQMGLIALKSPHKYVQEACIEWLKARLADKSWHQEGAVVKTLLTALYSAHQRGLAENLETIVEATIKQRGAKTWPATGGGCCSCAADIPSLQASYQQWQQEQATWPVTSSHAKSPTQQPGRLYDKVKEYVHERTQRHLQVRQAEVFRKQKQAAIAVWQKAHIPNSTPHFVGRKQIMATLEEGFQGEGCVIQVLYGPSGLGKSQVASRLAQGYVQAPRDLYDYVFWLSADTKEDLFESYVTMARMLGIALEGLLDQSTQVAMIKEHLKGKRCLYVFDNAKNLAQIAKYLPTQGSVLVTTHNGKPADWERARKPIALEAFKKNTIIALADKYGYKLDTLNEDATLKYLITELSGYPLTLNQFFSACKNCDMAPDVLTKELQAAELNAQEDLLLKYVLAKAPAYGKSMLKVLQKNLEALSKDHEGDGKLASSLLHQLAYLADEEVPQGWIVTLAKTDKIAVRRALQTLERYSLAICDKDQVSVHGLTQRVLRYRSSESPVVALGQSLISYAKVASKEERIDLLPHGRKLYQRLLKAAVPNEAQEAYGLSKCLFELCATASLHEESLSWAEKSLAAAQNYPGDNGMHIAHAQSLMGTSLSRLGRYEEAVKYKEETLKRRKALLQACKGAQAPDQRSAMLTELAFTHNNLGELYYHLGKHREATGHMIQALAIRQAFSSGKANKHLARSLNGLGAAIEGLVKQIATAPQGFTSVETCLQTAFDQVHHYELSVAFLAPTLNKLKGANAAQYYEIALGYKQQSLAMNQELGDKRATAHSLHNVGETLLALGKHTRDKKKIAQGIAHCKEALLIRQGIDQASLYIARTLNLLGEGLSASGEYSKGHARSQSALSMLKQLYPDQRHPHPDQGRVLKNIKRCLKQLGKEAQCAQHSSLAKDDKKKQDSGIANAIAAFKAVRNANKEQDFTLRVLLGNEIGPFRAHTHMTIAYLGKIGEQKLRALLNLLERQDFSDVAQEALTIGQLVKIGSRLDKYAFSVDTASASKRLISQLWRTYGELEAWQIQQKQEKGPLPSCVHITIGSIAGLASQGIHEADLAQWVGKKLSLRGKHIEIKAVGPHDPIYAKAVQKTQA
ncbi:MAG: tetratricopeptide repeat protein [Bacteroidota bacterium]